MQRGAKYLGLISLFFAIQLRSVAADQTSVATFKGQSNLVLIPTVVHDKSGAHIPNLAKDDFTITSDGDKRTIAVFEEVRPGNQLIQRAQTRPDEFTNMVNGQLKPNRLTVIALDTVNTPELRQLRAREGLLKVLEKTIRGDSMVALVLITTTGTRVVHDLTADPKVLLQALQEVVGSEPIARETRTTTEMDPLYAFGNPNSGSNSGFGKTDAQELQRYYRGEFERKAQELERKIAAFEELDALEEIGNALTGIPGRKSLIWVGGGFPLTINGAAMGVRVPESINYTSTHQAPNSQNNSQAPVPPLDPGVQFKVMLPHYERIWKILNDANIAIYGIDVRGLTMEGDAASVRFSSPNEQSRQRWLNWDTQDTFRVFADVTGGRAYTNTDDFERAYRESMDDSAAYYLLGYYADRKKDKLGWHDISVKVSRTGAEVRSRRGFVLRAADDKTTSEKELDLALRSPLEYTGLPVAGRWMGDTGSGAKRKVAFTVMLPANVGLIDENAQNHIDLEIYVRAQAADGTTVAHSGQEMEGRLTKDVAEKAKQEGIRYESTLELPPGEYTVHFVVRDKLSARIGSVSTTVKVGDTSSSEAK